MKKNKFKLSPSSNMDVAYLHFPRLPGVECSEDISKQISLHSLGVKFKGYEFYFDVNSAGEIIGLEILRD